MSKTLNIVSFDVPYPTNYGGVIDVFYKIKALNKLGVKIILHCFEYGKGEQKELEKYCTSVYYYKRTKNIKHFFSNTPFIVKSRFSQELNNNLKNNNYPIIFEGLHATNPILTNKLYERMLILRAHNIEHNYYNGLSKSESNIFKKLFFKIEKNKLFKYQNNLQHVNQVLTISPIEQLYFSDIFPDKASYIPAFHENNEISSKTGLGEYALYHGDLNVSDNRKACMYLIDVFKKINYPLIIASSLNTPHILKKLENFNNIQYKQIKDNLELNSLLKNAHINVLPTFQNTGIKLKLINSLYQGRFCLVNDLMVEDTGLENVCSIANSKNEFRKKILILSKLQFSQAEIDKRSKVLNLFDTKVNAQKIIDIIF